MFFQRTAILRIASNTNIIGANIKKIPAFLLLIAAIVILTKIYLSPQSLRDSNEQLNFSGQRAYEDVARQVAFGSRALGSVGHELTVDWLEEEIEAAGWQPEILEENFEGIPITNIVAKRGEGVIDKSPWIIIGTHYDTRLLADQDSNPEARKTPVPGANDGASGVAVLLELARTLPSDLPKNVWLIFFDAEDNGEINNWDWMLGSTAFVQNLERNPDIVVIIDMVGDEDLDIYLERNSNLEIATEIWEVAGELGFSDHFIPVPKYRMLDDHLPFANAGIPSVLIIDFDYPYWHTTNDTLDKVSPNSLEVVGKTIETWLIEQ